MKHLVLLGGGHAHLQVLQAFAKQRPPGAQLTLVTPSEQLLYSGMMPGWIAGHYALDACAIPLRPLAAAAGATFVGTTASGLDATARRIQLAGGRELAYDVLSLDVGATMDRDAIAGARENGLFLRPIEHFARLWDGVVRLAGERSLCIVVIGAGAAGVETAMAVQHRFGERVRVSLVTGGPPPLASHPIPARTRVQRALRRRNITVLTEPCSEITPTHVVLASGVRVACDAPFLAIGASPPKWLAASGLALDVAGFVATGDTLQSTSHQNVFAAGDVASRVDVAQPKGGVYAVRAGPALAFNLRRYMAAGELKAHQSRERALSLLSCGDRYAIANWGDLAAEGRWVWHWKDRIDRGFVARFAPGAASEVAGSERDDE
jgi:pyridine nucleotide-disulfide oxidoreductase family protein